MKIALLLALSAVSALADDPILPDPKLTPGVIAFAVSDVCAVKWGKDERHVTLSMKKAVFASYGIPWERHLEFEVDHLISRELGGADDVLNLWPQPRKGQWTAGMKDRLENRLHEKVCGGQLALADAQAEIRSDWIAVYQKEFP